MPTLDGRGPGFRAYQWVNYLKHSYKKVTVVCSSVYGEYESVPGGLMDHPDIQIYASPIRKGLFLRFLNVLALKPSTYNTVSADFERWFKGLGIENPHFILGFKITGYPIVKWLKSEFRAAQTAIDIDEVNSIRVRSIASLMLENGRYGSAWKLIPEIVGYRMLESVVLKGLDSVIVSTQKEKKIFEKISAVRPCEIFENKFPLQTPAEKKDDRVYKLLFVGNSIHYPNRDAIEIIVKKIYPEIKRRASKAFKIVIIGGKLEKGTLSAIKESAEIEYLFDTDDLQAIYQQCDAALIPLRSGGGSSVKLLEALANRKTVISTSTGVRGFKLKHGSHCLISDNPSTLASYCVELINDRDLNTKLAENGYRWYLEHQSYKSII
jgi:glycosyltransferase involved in cell wall biosynthesis